MKGKLTNAKGITLVALVVTIIVLIILAGVSVRLLLGENGIIQRAKGAVEEYEKTELKEQIALALVAKQIETKSSLTDQEIENILNNYGEVEKDGDTIVSLKPTGKEYKILLSDVYKGRIENGPQKIEVTLNPNGGIFADSSTETKVVETSNGKITLPNITKSNATFIGWYTSNSNTATRVGNAGDEYEPSSSIQLYAWWNTKYVPTSNEDQHIIYSDFTIGESNSIIHAFDNNTTTYAWSTGGGTSAVGSWIGWDFESPVYVRSVTGKIRMTKYKIEYADSLDGQWTQVLEETSACNGNGDNISNTFSNYETIGKHRYWRMYVSGNNTSDSRWSAIIYELNFNIYNGFDIVNNNPVIYFNGTSNRGDVLDAGTHKQGWAGGRDDPGLSTTPTIKVTTSSNQATIYFEDKVNVTDYDYIDFTVDNNYIGFWGASLVGITQSVAEGFEPTTTEEITGTGVIRVDVRNYTGEYYVIIMKQEASTFEISKVELIKE